MPINNFKTCRSVKTTPLHKSQAENGAVFEQQLNLFERAAWFESTDDYYTGLFTLRKVRPASKLRLAALNLR